MRTVPLGEVSSSVMGQAPPGGACNKDGKGTPFVKAGEFSDRFPVVREWTTDPLKHSRLGDVLICVVGATAGKINHGIDCAIGRSVAAIRPDARRLNSDFLYYFMRQKAEEMRAKSQGLAQGVITRDMIAEIQIPLPPLDEQKRIAAILDQADALRRKRQRALDRLNELGQAIFMEMFGDLIQNEKAWPAGGTLGDHTEIASGITKGRDPKGRPTRLVPYLAVVNVQDKRLQLDAPKEIEATEDEILRYRLQPGDLLLTEGGDPDKLGRGTLWNAELPECIHQNHVFRVRLSSKEYNPIFLNWIVGSAYGKKYFLRAAKQTTGIASINMSQLKAFPLILPPIELQNDFKRRLDQLGSGTEKFAIAARSTEDLFTSLQHRAFSGEL